VRRIAAADRRTGRNAAVSFKTIAARAALAWVFLAALTTGPATSKCGTGNPPSYDDITGIQFERYDNCSQFAPKDVQQKCWSYSFFVSNWDHYQNEVREYEQFSPPSQAGDYTLNVTADDVIAILKQYKFFDLNPANIVETDVGYTVLTVKHCAVVTRIALPPEQSPGAFMRVGGANFDHATQALFDALDAFAKNGGKTLRSRKPQHTEYDWDGW
jgi:hypothetical protein